MANARLAWITFIGSSISGALVLIDPYYSIVAALTTLVCIFIMAVDI